MRKEILDYLCCSESKGDLELKIIEEVDKKMKEGVLVCKNCKKEFKILSFIPRFVERL